MFEVEKDQCWETGERLLFNIWQELRKLNDRLSDEKQAVEQEEEAKEQTIHDNDKKEQEQPKSEQQQENENKVNDTQEIDKRDKKEAKTDKLKAWENCKYCDGSHENSGQYASCAKKHKNKNKDKE